MSKYVKIKIETLVELQNDLEYYKDMEQQLRQIRNNFLNDEEAYKRAREQYLKTPEHYND